jgi:hypothetical protein
MVRLDKDLESLVIAMSNRSICLVWLGGLIDDGGYSADGGGPA